MSTPARLPELAALGVRAGTLPLRNTGFDSGEVRSYGEYRLADETYAKLVHKLAESRFAGVTDALRRDILQYYRGVGRRSDLAKRERKEWKRLEPKLASLRAQQRR